MKFLRWAFAALVLGLAIAYAVDSLIFRFQNVKYSSVHVVPYYAVPRKDKKTEFLLGEAKDETCVNALFPRDADTPCWYLRRHKQEEIDL